MNRYQFLCALGAADKKKTKKEKRKRKSLALPFSPKESPPTQMPIWSEKKVGMNSMPS